jgi:hypothetical protein
MTTMPTGVNSSFWWTRTLSSGWRSIKPSSPGKRELSSTMRDRELIQRDQILAYVHFAWCSCCGTEFTCEPDSGWVTVVLPGMRSSKACTELIPVIR